MADHAHLQADPVLEEFQRDRCMDRLVEDRLVFAVTERQAFDVAKPALRRILDAGFSLQMIARNPDLAHREGGDAADLRSEEHTSELQSLMRISYAVFCLKKKIQLIHQSQRHL